MGTFKDGQFDFAQESPVPKNTASMTAKPTSTFKNGQFEFGTESPKQMPSPTIAPVSSTPISPGATPLTGAKQLGAEAVAGAEMGAAMRFLPLAGKILYPAAQALQAGVKTAEKYPDHKLEHWGDIAKGASEGLFNPQNTITNTVLQATGNPIDDKNLNGWDAAATIGGGMLAANLKPGNIINMARQLPSAAVKTALQAPAAAIATGAGAAIQHGGEALIDKFITDPQNNAALKAALGLGAAGGGGAIAHGLSKGAGAVWNKVPDAIKSTAAAEAMPNSQERAYADELTKQLGTPEGKHLISEDTAKNTGWMNISPENTETSMGRANHRVETLKQVQDVVKNAEDMAGLGYKKLERVVDKDLINIPSEQIKKHFDINEASKGEDEYKSAMEEAKEAHSTDKIEALQSLKKVYDFTKENFFKPALAAKTEGGDVNFTYQDYKKFLELANALKNSLNTKGMPQTIVRQLNNTIPLVKNAFKAHLNEKEFNGTPEERERYAGSTDLHSNNDKLWGHTQEVKHRTPFVDEINSTKDTDQARQSQLERADIEHLQSGYPTAGVEHITRAMENVLPHLPEGAEHVVRNREAVPDIFKKSLELAIGNKKGMSFLDSHNYEKALLKRKDVPVPDIIPTEGAEGLVNSLDRTKANIENRQKELSPSDGSGNLMKMLLTRGIVPKLAKMAHVGLKSDTAPAREKALMDIKQNMGSSLGREKLRAQYDEAEKIKELQSRYNKSNLKSAIGAGLVSNAMRNATPGNQTPVTPTEDEVAYKARMKRQASEMAAAKRAGLAWRR